MIFKNISILDENFQIRNDMYVGIEGSRIDYVGDKAPEKNYGEVISGKTKLIMPGFYNSHAHSPMALMRGYGENLSLQDWLVKKVFPFEAHLDSNAVYWGTMLCMAESLKYGIVSSSDMYFFVSDMAKAIADAGTKANISRAISGTGDSDISSMDSIKEMKTAAGSIHGSHEGRILMDVSLHAEYTSDRKIAEYLADYAKNSGFRMHVHVSETEKEHLECKERHEGMTPVAYLADCGLFDVPTTAAHCVWVEDEDIDILKRQGVTVAANPVSNQKLASGLAPLAKFLERGVKVAIGTDSVASNNNLNFIEEIKSFALVGKVGAMNPEAITPTQALRAATIEGALSQGRYDCGVIREGNRADIIMIETSGVNMHPVHDMLNNLVYSMTESDIRMTMVDGRILYKDGEYVTIDEEKTIAETEKAAANILKRL